MITIYSKLTCDHCFKSEEGDVVYGVSAPPGAPAAMSPARLLPSWRAKLVGYSKYLLLCSQDCEDKVARK
jgi:hypothetical protein